MRWRKKVIFLSNVTFSLHIWEGVAWKWVLVINSSGWRRGLLLLQDRSFSPGERAKTPLPPRCGAGSRGPPGHDVFPARRPVPLKNAGALEGRWPRRRLKGEPRGGTDALVSQQERRRGAPVVVSPPGRGRAGGGRCRWESRWGRGRRRAAACFSGHVAERRIVGMREDVITTWAPGLPAVQTCRKDWTPVLTFDLSETTNWLVFKRCLMFCWSRTKFCLKNPTN